MNSKVFIAKVRSFFEHALYVEKCSCKQYYVTVIYVYIWPVFDNRFRNEIYSTYNHRSVLSSLKNSWWPPVIQPIYNLLCYHRHVTQGTDQ
jgi:hypothetical protein